MKIDYQNKIEDYLFNRMPAEKRLEFEQELKTNAELREQYEFISTLRTALILENIENNVSLWNKVYKEELAKQDDPIVHEYKATGSGYERTVACPRYEENTTRSSKRHVLYWISGIAAVFIVGFFMYNSFYFFEAAPSRQDNAAYSPHPQGVSTIRGVDGKTENLLAKGDFQEALTRIETLEEEVATELMLIEREINSRGVVKEDKLAYKIEDVKYRQEEILWLKLHALLGLNRIDEAIVLLDKIRCSDSEYKEQADSLYKVLNKKDM